MRQSWFFEKQTKLNKPLVRLTNKKRERSQINKIRGEKGNIATSSKEI
jgi:hypothetical protein